jgi:hypothetical protein
MAGIATLKKALKFLFDVAKSAEVKLEDSKLSFPEMVTLAYDARGVLDLIKERKELGEEIVDVTDEEFDELVIWAKEEFELDNDEVEALVEDLLDFIAQGTKVFWDIKDLLNKDE